MKSRFIVLILFCPLIFLVEFKVNAMEDRYVAEGISSNLKSNNSFLLPSSNLPLDISDRTYDYVVTPNGSSVQVYQYKNDFQIKDVNNSDLFCDQQYPNATRVGPTTQNYNCHSYAWYMSSTSNKYNMEDPSPYYKDGSYDQVVVPRSDDVICYFYDSGTPNDFSDDINLHSGIVISYESSILSNEVCGNSNQVIVRSKWGSRGLYEHRGDYCPYVSSYGGNASYIRFYRRHSHQYTDHYCSCGKYTGVHSYRDPYIWRSYTLHVGHCSCGDKKEVPHVVREDEYLNHKDRFASCLFCGGLAEIGFVFLNSQFDKKQYVTSNGSFILLNGVIVLVDEDIEDYIKGSLEFHLINSID